MKFNDIYNFLVEGVDGSYLKAVDSGDIEAVQSMVNDRAKKMGYTIGPVYHGTKSKFNKFDFSQSYENKFWVTNNKSDIERGEVGAQGRGVILSLYAKINNPADWDAYEKSSHLQHDGYDGAILKDSDSEYTAFVFKSSQVKFTDPITYDDSGKIIPLSKRFNSKNNDMRY
jgi:hypothetical protein